MSFRRFLASSAIFAIGLSSASSLTMPQVFGDHMVLQSGQSVPVWGWAGPGETVTVSFASQKKQATAANDGRWEVQLDPLTISAQPAELTVTGAESVTIKDVLVGEVWLCSGQSNMQKPLGTWRGQPIPTVNYEQELAAAKYPIIRLMKVKRSDSEKPANDFETRSRPGEDYPWKGWVACSPESLDESKFSAVGYYFARKLFQELKVPIGMIEASAGGTHIEAWTPAAGFADDPTLADFVKAAVTPKVKFRGTTISTLYNGMIHPMVPFSLRGVLWYQGESNLIEGDGAIYANKMTTLIKSWRAVWKRELPFYFVQLPPLIYSARTNPSHTPTDLPLFREAQETALELPSTGMVVTTDVGDLKNMHPPRKKEVGERLALWALSKDYGRTGVEYSGPEYRQGSIELQGSKAVLHFDHVGKGLVSSDEQALNSFMVAGDDGVFFPAKAEISNDTIVITSPQVANPRLVRFAWDEAATPNLFNRDGLPAIPFRTDKPSKKTLHD